MDFSSLMMDHIPEEKKMQVRIVQLFVKNEFNKEKHRGPVWVWKYLQNWLYLVCVAHGSVIIEIKK